MHTSRMMPMDASLHMTQVQTSSRSDTEHMELRQELIDKESILALEQQRALLNEVKAAAVQKEIDLENLRLQQLKESARMDALENALSRTSARKVVLEREVQEKDMEIKRLLENTDILRSEHTTLLVRVEEQEQEIQALRGALFTANKQATDLHQQLGNQIQLSNDLQRRVDVAVENNKVLQDRTEKTEQQASELDTQLTLVRKENGVLSKAVLLTEQIANQSLIATKELAKKVFQLDRVLAELRRQKDFASGHLELLLDETLRVRRILGSTPKAVLKLRSICKAAVFVGRLMEIVKGKGGYGHKISNDNDCINRSVNGLRAEDIAEIAGLVDNTTYNSMRSQDAITLLALKSAVHLECNFVKSISGAGPVSKQMRNKWAFLSADGKKTMAEAIKELKTDLRTLSETCCELQKINGEIKDSMLRKNSECTTLQGQVASLQADKNLLEGDIEGLNRRVSELYDNLTNLKVNHDTKCREFNSLLSSLKQCEEELEQRINEVANLKSRIVIMTESMDERERRNMQLERDLQRLQGNIRCKEAEIESTRRVVDQLAIESQNTRKEAEEKLRILRETEAALERERNERAERARRRIQLLENRAIMEDAVSNQIEDAAREANRLSVSSGVGGSHGYGGFDRSHAPPLTNTYAMDHTDRDITTAMENRGMIDRSVSFSIHAQPRDTSASYHSHPRSPSAPTAPITASPLAVSRASERLTKNQMRDLMASVGSRGYQY